MRRIDLNADLGEGFGRWSLGDDDALLGIVSSANVACGFHAGDPSSLLSVLRIAADKQVAVGAHVSYRDLAGFGRRYVDASVDELRADVLYQIGALEGLARAVGSRVSYVKPHGALYNTIATGHPHAMAVIDAITSYDRSLPLVVLAASPLEKLATDAGLTIVREAFADRAYLADGSLVPRDQPGSVLHDTAQIVERMSRLAATGTIVAADGTELQLPTESICVHGDTPGAVAVASAVRGALVSAGLDIRSFVSA